MYLLTQHKADCSPSMHKQTPQCRTPCTDCPGHLCPSPKNHARSGAAGAEELALLVKDRRFDQQLPGKGREP